ncbi:transposase [Streptomyces sp. LBUM 1483]|nr:transposase [Streptomyces sp. LBUM 1481]MBP5921166.1 transposase [Streptomyces sp. LBUM 1483]
MVVVAESSSSTRGCDCLAHRFGNAVDRPQRRPRYGSDMSDAEWAVVRDLLPVPGWLSGRGGRPEGYCHRQMIDAVRYLVDNGIKWRAMPADFPPWPRVYAFFARWRDTGLVTELHDRLLEAVRAGEGRSAEPSAGVVDSQSVKADATVTLGSRGFDAGKKTSDAKNVSSGEGKTGFSQGREGYGLVERDAVSQTVVEAADHPVEEVPLRGRVPISGLASAVVVSPRSV